MEIFCLRYRRHIARYDLVPVVQNVDGFTNRLFFIHCIRIYSIDSTNQVGSVFLDMTSCSIGDVIQTKLIRLTLEAFVT